MPFYVIKKGNKCGRSTYFRVANLKNLLCISYAYFTAKLIVKIKRKSQNFPP